MSTEFPQNAFGRCPLGHNPTPGTSGGAYSANQIGSDEEQPLVWSDYWQMYVCKMHKDKESDETYNKDFSERDAEEEKFRQSAGFTNSIQ